MKSNIWATMGAIAIAILPITASIARCATIDNGYTVDPCYKRCAPLLSSVTPRQEARRVYKNCFAYCNHKGLIECPGGVFVKPNRTCP